MEKLKILIIPIIIPYPISDGGKICTFSFIDKLQNINDFTLFLHSNNLEDTRNIELLKNKLPNVNIVISQNYKHEEDFKLNFNFGEFLKSFLRNIYNWFFKTNLSNTKNSQIDLMENVGRTTPFFPHSKKYIEKLSLLFQNYEFDIIQIEYTENLNLINCLPVNVKKIYIEIESRYSVLNDYINIKAEKSLFDSYVCNNTKMLETAYLSKYDAILALSQIDKERLKKILPSTPIYSSPFSVSDENIQKIDKENFRIEKLIFIGPEAHYPNKDAVLFFLNEVYSLFDFSIPVHIVGNWSEETKNQLGSNKIIFEGYAENINEILKNSIMLVPIRLGGGGLRTKILLAMAQGIPIISTSLGADGFDFKQDEHFTLANTPIEFYKKIKFLFEHKSKAFEIAQNAQNLFIDKYSQQQTAEIRNEIYHKILINA